MHWATVDSATLWGSGLTLALAAVTPGVSICTRLSTLIASVHALDTLGHSLARLSSRRSACSRINPTMPFFLAWTILNTTLYLSLILYRLLRPAQHRAIAPITRVVKTTPIIRVVSATPSLTS